MERVPHPGPSVRERGPMGAPMGVDGYRVCLCVWSVDCLGVVWCILHTVGYVCVCVCVVVFVGVLFAGMCDGGVGQHHVDACLHVVL